MKKLYTNKVQKRIKHLHMNTKDDVVLSKFAYKKLVEANKTKLEKLAKSMRSDGMEIECKVISDQTAFKETNAYFNRLNSKMRSEHYKRYNHNNQTNNDVQTEPEQE